LPTDRNRQDADERQHHDGVDERYDVEHQSDTSERDRPPGPARFPTARLAHRRDVDPRNLDTRNHEFESRQFRENGLGGRFDETWIRVFSVCAHGTTVRGASSKVLEASNLSGRGHGQPPPPVPDAPSAASYLYDSNTCNTPWAV
jgi:hypothetical protein